MKTTFTIHFQRNISWKKQRHKETQIFFDKFASSICFDATLSKLMSRSLITTIPITPPFACIYFSFYGKMRLSLRNLMSKSICVCLCWQFVRTLPNKNRVRDEDHPLWQRYIKTLVFQNRLISFTLVLIYDKCGSFRLRE